MNGHPFNFEGGLELSRIGASWFVSYLYHIIIDKSHLNWNRIATVDYRKSVFNKTEKYYKYWLGKVLEMDNKRLNTNKIGVKTEQTKEMARKLLKRETEK